MTGKLQQFKVVMNLNYDIICPRSWIFHKIIKKKKEFWQSKADLDINYIPMVYPSICQETYGLKPASLFFRKKDYLLQELNNICIHYDLDINCDLEMKHEHLMMRSISTLLLLNHLRKWLNEFYEPFLEKIWENFWCASRPTTKTAQFHKIGRELGIPFNIMDDAIMRIERRSNYLDLSDNTRYLLEEERITGSPWFQLKNDKGEIIFGFSEIPRLEFVDEFFRSLPN